MTQIREGDGKGLATKEQLGAEGEEVGVSENSTDQLRSMDGSQLKNDEGLCCNICGATGIKDQYNLGRHISRMHSGSVLCNVCKVEFTDRHSFNVHSNHCYYYCPIEGCLFKEKMKFDWMAIFVNIAGNELCSSL